MSITIREAVDILAMAYPRLTSEGFASRFADEVIGKMWMKFPWRQSIKKLPPFHTVAYESDYGPPTSAVPADFFAIHDAWLKNVYSYDRPLAVVANLKPSLNTGEPDSICYVPENTSFRLSPRPNLNPPYWWVEGRYKKKPTRITDATIASALFPFDDLYFHVFRQGMYWKYQQEILKSGEHMTQYGLFMTMLKEMATSEGIHQGAQVVHPEFELSLGD